MTPTLGDVVPDFEADSTHGKISLHEYVRGSWAILFSHPSDFTPVCTTELGYLASHINEFQSRGVKVLALSCDDLASHNAWVADIESYCPTSKISYPIVADPKREIAHKYGMLDDVARDAAGVPFTCRAVFVIGPNLRLRLSLLYPASTGRNMAEIIRVIDSLQLADKFALATPVNWEQGGKCMIFPTVSNEDAKKNFPGFETVSLPSGKGYLRVVNQPTY